MNALDALRNGRKEKERRRKEKREADVVEGDE